MGGACSFPMKGYSIRANLKYQVLVYMLLECGLIHKFCYLDLCGLGLCVFCMLKNYRPFSWPALLSIAALNTGIFGQGCWKYPQKNLWCTSACDTLGNETKKIIYLGFMPLFYKMVKGGVWRVLKWLDNKPTKKIFKNINDVAAGFNPRNDLWKKGLFHLLVCDCVLKGLEIRCLFWTDRNPNHQKIGLLSCRFFYDDVSRERMAGSNFLTGSNS